MLRRSDFIAATYALSLVFANFGIAIAARMPMMTTTIRSSIRVKPFLLLDIGQFSCSGWEAGRNLRGLTLKTLRERIRNPIAAICFLANHHSDMALHARSNAMDVAFCKPCTVCFSCL